MDRLHTLTARLQDRRGKRVVFLSHCLLNENTRYLGGACRAGCVPEVVESCLEHGLGMVQMPCPEERAWGGVRKRWLLAVYGAKRSPLYRLRGVLLPLMLWYTKRIYARLAREIAHQVKDYLDSGLRVVGIVGVDGSPSCGLNATLDLRRSFEAIAHLEPEAATPERMNAIVRRSLTPGHGLFTGLLYAELERRGVKVSFFAHDLIAELSGQPSTVGLEVALARDGTPRRANST